MTLNKHAISVMVSSGQCSGNTSFATISQPNAAVRCWSWVTFLWRFCWGRVCFQTNGFDWWQKSVAWVLLHLRPQFLTRQWFGRVPFPLTHGSALLFELIKISKLTWLWEKTIFNMESRGVNLNITGAIIILISLWKIAKKCSHYKVINYDHDLLAFLNGLRSSS